MSSDQADSAGQANAEGRSPSRHVLPRDERLGTMIFAAALALFGLFWIYASSDLPSRQQTAYLSQGFLPITAGILLAVLAALLFISTWLTRSKPASELGREPLFEAKAEARGAAVFAVLLIYILILPYVHYLISTFLLMAAGLYIAREPIGLRLLVLAAAMAGIFFGIFVWSLGVPLPGSGFE